MSNVLLFYMTPMTNILPKMVINGTLVRDKFVNNSISSNEDSHN